MYKDKILTKVGLVCFVFVIITGIAVWFFTTGVFGSGVEANIDSSKYYPVAHVIDGDTFITSVDGRNVTVRALGINTPETVDKRKGVECYGPQASAKAKEFLIGHKVQLVFNQNREKEDKYGRLLAYVYLDNGIFYNEEMIRQGFAKEYTFGKPYSFQKEFRSIENLARKNGLGLWGECFTHDKSIKL